MSSQAVIEDLQRRLAVIESQGLRYRKDEASGDDTMVFRGGRVPLIPQVAFDAVSNVAAGTGTLSWTHTPVGTPRGILVGVVTNNTFASEVSGVTYGGISMQPVGALAHSTGSEDGAITWWWLGQEIPTGAQTVSVTVSGANSKRAVAYSLTATGTRQLYLAGVGKLDSGGVANPSVTVPTPTGVSTFVAGALHSGQDASASVVPTSGFTEVLGHDFGSQTASWVRRTDNATGGNVTVDWTVASEEAGVFAVAVRAEPPRDLGRGTVLPTNPAIGDRFCLDHDNFGQDQDWELVYDALNSTHPWKKVGGPPLRAYNETETSTLSSLSYSAFETPPSITLPNAGFYLISHGFTAYSPSVNHYAYQAAFDDGSQITNHEIFSWTYNVYQTDSLHCDPGQTTAVGAGSVIDVRNKSGGGNHKFLKRWLEIDCSRLG